MLTYTQTEKAATLRPFLLTARSRFYRNTPVRIALRCLGGVGDRTLNALMIRHADVLTDSGGLVY